MNRRYTSRSKHIDFILLDILIVEISFFMAYKLRLGNAGDIVGNYVLMNVLVLLIHISVAFFMECYSGILRRGYFKELKSVFLHNFELFAIVTFVLFLLKQSSDYSRLMFILFFGINTILMYITRCLRKRFLQRGKKDGYNISHMLIAAYKEQIPEIIETLFIHNCGDLCIDGVVLLDELGDNCERTINGIRVVANRGNFLEYVKCNVIDEVLLCCNEKDKKLFTEKLLSMGVIVHISLDVFLADMPNPVIETINKYAVVTTSINQITFKQRVIKRTMDICGACIGLAITVILFIIFAPIIFIQSPGPIFFTQNRVGKNGRIFKIYKFRSMYMDAEERKKELLCQNKMQGLMFKMENDPRIIPVGRFMRKTSIDEFPQFLNVLKGDMSLVGTRPPTVDEYMQYDFHHKSRLAIKPGLTGMWQVSGRSNITDFEEVVRLDNEYIMNFSLSLDVKILWRTVFVVLGQKGSE